MWTPERHFHAFGGLYPNPSVTGAAVAAVTKNVGVRAGSCVLPLHHPARVAEEWAVVDNLSNGRVAHLVRLRLAARRLRAAPREHPARQQGGDDRGDRHAAPALARRGGRVPDRRGQAGRRRHPAAAGQPELPVWVTTAGNPETCKEAGALGANVLTHLLGQTIEELAEKIALYRAACARAGHDPARPQVTLMLHTFVGADREAVREIAREPMKDYLRSAAALIKQYAWAFPAFKKPAGRQQPDAARPRDAVRGRDGRRARVRLPPLLRGLAACSAPSRTASRASRR